MEASYERSFVDIFESYIHTDSNIIEKQLSLDVRLNI